MEIKFIYSNALLSKIQMTLKRETYPISTSYIEIANSLGTDKIQIGLRVLKITKRGSITNKPQAATLGTILLRNEVVVRELDKVASCILLIICRTCLSKSGFRKKRGKNEGKYQMARTCETRPAMLAGGAV
jgi:hypothetical protein